MSFPANWLLKSSCTGVPTVDFELTIEHPNKQKSRKTKEKTDINLSLNILLLTVTSPKYYLLLIQILVYSDTMHIKRNLEE